MMYTKDDIQVMSMMIKKMVVPWVCEFSLMGEDQKNESFKHLQELELIDEHKKLTEFGRHQLFALDLFCQSTTHLNYGGLIIGQYEDQRILLAKIDEKYQIAVVSETELTLMLIAKLPDVLMIEDKRYQRKRMSKEVFGEALEKLDGKQVIYYEKKRGIDTTNLGILYVDEGYLVTYDQIDGVMQKYPKSMVQSTVETIIKGEAQIE